MKVKIIAEIEADIRWMPDNVINSDTIGDYKAELDCNIENAACEYLGNQLNNWESIKILSAQPNDIEGIKEFSAYLNEYQQKYNLKNN